MSSQLFALITLSLILTYTSIFTIGYALLNEREFKFTIKTFLYHIRWPPPLSKWLITTISMLIPTAVAAIIWFPGIFIVPAMYYSWLIFYKWPIQAKSFWVYDLSYTRPKKTLKTKGN